MCLFEPLEAREIAIRVVNDEEQVGRRFLGCKERKYDPPESRLRRERPTPDMPVETDRPATDFWAMTALLHVLPGVLESVETKVLWGRVRVAATAIASQPPDRRLVNPIGRSAGRLIEDHAICQEHRQRAVSLIFASDGDPEPVTAHRQRLRRPTLLQE